MKYLQNIETNTDDAGPEQAIKRSTEIFGLSDTACVALKTRAHGPREGGATFLAQFATIQPDIIKRTYY